MSLHERVPTPRVDPRHFGWGNTGGEPLYLGGITGYRYWRISEEGLLKSVSQGYAWSRADKELNATCLLEDNKHPAPESSCRCGFYAWYTPEDARRNHVNSGYGITTSYFPYNAGSGNSILVLGAAFVSGLIVPGTEGMRAEKMKPLGVVITTIKHKVRVLTFQQTYPTVKIFPSSDALVKHFPPEKDVPWATIKKGKPRTLHYLSDDKIEEMTPREILCDVLSARKMCDRSSARFTMSPQTFYKLTLAAGTLYHSGPATFTDCELLLGIPLQLLEKAEGILLEEI